PGGTGGHALASSSLHSASSPPSAPLPAVPVKPPVPSRPPVPPGFAAAQKSRSIVAHDATASNASTPAVRRATTPRLYHRRCAAAAVEQRRALVRSPAVGARPAATVAAAVDAGLAPVLQPIGA